METGLRNNGDHDGTRTRNLQIDSLLSCIANSCNMNMLHEAKIPPDTHRDTFTSKPIINDAKASFADLAAIVASWLSVPDPIKTAVKAVLAPYLIVEG